MVYSLAQMKEDLEEKSLDSQLWHACAGSMVQMPSVNSRVYYFPQGHAEHAKENVDFDSVSMKIPGFILCRVVDIVYLADRETDEVYAKLRLFPVNEMGYGEGGVFGSNGSENGEKLTSFAKTLTQSDANNGGGFSVPRYCAETILPPLDYTLDPPLQTLFAKDIHGKFWKFRHIYRGTPRRHLLTTGWSSFVNAKKLVAGDTILFLKADNGDLFVGIRRAKRGHGGGIEPVPYGGISKFSRDDEKNSLRNVYGAESVNSNSGGGWRGNKRVKAESVVEAAYLAASGQPFDVLYHPCAGTPEYCVRESVVKAAMMIQWRPNTRFKMAFETEDSSRISWYMGTISSVHFADPVRWPNSPWRLLQVVWDEPDILQNINRVSPWLVELVSSFPIIHMSPFPLQPTKKYRLNTNTALDGQFLFPSPRVNPRGPNSPLSSISDNIPASIQGARHAHIEKSLSDLQLKSKLQEGSGLFQSSFRRFDPHSRSSAHLTLGPKKSIDDISCLLTMGTTTENSEKSDIVKTPHFLLFGQPILTAQQMSRNRSSNEGSQVLSSKVSEEENIPEKERVLSNRSGCKRPADNLDGSQLTELGSEGDHCLVFMESEDVGRTLDLSLLGSYDELYRMLANMFGYDNSEAPTHVLYRDATGSVKHAGDESFSIFMKTAKTITILKGTDGKSIGRNQTVGLRYDENGIDSSNKPEPMSIFG